MEKIIGLKEFRQNVEKYALEAKKGKGLIIMKRSKPLFRVAPFNDEEWEEVIDFTKIRKGGVLVKELLSRL